MHHIRKRMRCRESNAVRSKKILVDETMRPLWQAALLKGAWVSIAAPGTVQEYIGIGIVVSHDLIASIVG